MVPGRPDGHSGGMTNHTGTDGPRRLVRIREGRMIAGVCTGLGAYLGVDPVLVRVIFVVLTVLGGGGLLVYLAAWLLMPEA